LIYVVVNISNGRAEIMIRRMLYQRPAPMGFKNNTVITIPIFLRTPSGLDEKMLWGLHKGKVDELDPWAFTDA
jgi:hypothetical protein